MNPLQTFLCGSSGAALITGAWALIKWLAERHAKKKDDMKVSNEERMEKQEKMIEALVAADRLLFYIQIKDRIKAAIARGWTTTEELEDLSRMHDLYHGPLDGNGYLDDLMEKLRGLPVHEQKGE